MFLLGPSIRGLPASGEITIRVRALTSGSEMNATGGTTTGTLTTPAPGINTEVIICGGEF